MNFELPTIIIGLQDIPKNETSLYCFCLGTQNGGSRAATAVTTPAKPASKFISAQLSLCTWLSWRVI